MAAEHVLIVGAGPTGLFLALVLARLGAKPRIIDKDAGPGETSRAMAVHARTLEFYRQLGIADDITGRGLKVQQVSIRESGRLKGAFAFGDLGAGLSAFPFILSFPQDAHEQALLAHLAAAGVTVERDTELIAYHQTPTEVRATLRTPAGTQTAIATYIAGCDGAHSTVRERAGIGLPGGTYTQRFYVADAQVEGEAARDSMNICLTGHDFCLVIPLHRPGEVRLIGIVPDGIDPDHISFQDIEPSVRRNTALAINQVAWFSSYRVHHRVSAQFRDGRAFLLGDAAHLHSPVGGQGMNTGLGDAMNLAWKLAAVLAGRAAPAILDSYEPERIAFAHRLVASTDRMFTLITNRGLIGKLWRKVVMARVLPLAFRLPAAPRAAFRQVSQIRIGYRNSTPSQGRAGRVRAGDRLPWVATAQGDNFEPLTALDWQIHIYGTAPDHVRDAARTHEIGLHVFPWSDAAKAKGLARDALYLLRPDGHVALAQISPDRAALESYLAHWGIRGGHPGGHPAGHPGAASPT